MNDYKDIVAEKYSSEEMRNLFSEQNIVRTWRLCWIALAEAEAELGLKEITKEMIDELKKNIDNIDLAGAKEKEKETQHDVAAQIHAYGKVCPKAKGIIHLGATSQYVKCNTDLILQREALSILRKKLVLLLEIFAKQILKYKDVPTLSYTHYQSAQPTTIGRRLCNYAQDLLTDLEDLDRVHVSIKSRGAKGTTGTQATFLTLFNNDHKKVKKLDTLIAKKLGFSESYSLTTQTYSRKEDIKIHSVLAGIAASAKRFATDLRLLSNLKIMEEPFGKKQVGSSAMPYKQNPMHSERISSLSRKVMNNLKDFYDTYAEQWLERSLDDSAIRRIDIPENFMLTEHIIDLLTKIMKDLVVNEHVSRKMLENELPFLASEEIILSAVKKGKDRQIVHEAIKEHSIAVTKRIKLEGGENDLLERISQDKRIGLTKEELKKLLDSNKFIGRSRE
ncbi:MAG: adenylosuccinate lyase, partial [Nanoarchaeota archaeon]